ncbi:MAG: outer membrane protein assembly factor BamA [Bacteroidaceae bacterium]|nr:outer membrane protein assembly factor BamA [Bacteroidaceae bacterium]
MKSKYIILLLLTATLPLLAQSTKEVKPTIDYGRTPREYILGGIAVSGVQNYDEYLLVGLSGLQVGQKITIPGDQVTKAIRRYWRHGLFSSVAIEVDSIVRDSAFLHIRLTQRPRISEIRYTGVKKGERDELERKLGLVREGQMTPNTIDRAKILAKKYFDEKGFKNADISIMPKDDASKPDHVIVEVDINKKDKVKVNHIYIRGNNNLSEKKIKGNLISKGVLKTIHERHNMGSWFRSKKFTDKKYKEAKENLIEKYAQLGFRDAYIVSDSVVPFDEKSVNIYLNIDEGARYYIRNVEWVGNTLYNTDALNELLRMKKGDVYDQKLLNQRLSSDEDAIGNLYYNNGYVFYQLDPVETNIVGDSVDLEMRIYEGGQAHISHVRIIGNDRVYENVVRRELRNKPGDLFSKEAMERSYREIASMGFFDPESIDPKVEPKLENGTVDMAWGLTPKSNDQIEFSLGYGQTGVIGKIGLKFSNFCIANLFNKNGLRRGVMPQGNGETFSISGQTNGRYYQAYSASYMNPWFGGKRPSSLSVSAFFSKQTDVSDRYYNQAYYQNYYNNYLYGYGNNGYNNSYYENFYDPDKYVKIMGASIGWGKRLSWPDDYFQFSADLGYTRYKLKDWEYFLISNGNCNSLALNLSLARTSTDNQIFPRRGSEFIVSASITPPFSLFDNKNYENLATNYNSSSYKRELQDKYRWIEYHKWKFKARTFTALTRGSKCLVLMTRVEFGVLGHYNKYKKSPFETFYVGGDGTSGYSSTYATETIGLRGYDNGSLTNRAYGYAYDRFTIELRYPLMLGNSANIYALSFLEGGNAWHDIKKFNPFDMKRSAGFGVRIMLPMVGLLGIDWAYGFDKVLNNNGMWEKGGSQFHFILGQEF